MPNRPPCVAWGEKLALRYEDLSPADQADLDAHIKTCAVCQAAQADYHFLDARLRALPPSVIKSFPRLPFTLPVTEEGATADEPARPTRQFSDARQQATPARPISTLIKKALGTALIACLVLTLLLAFQGRSIDTSVAHQPGATLLTYDRHSNFVAAVAWSPDGRYLASGSWDHTVQVWDARTGALVLSYRHNDIVDAVAWSPNSEYIASGSWDGTVQVWDVRAPRHILRTYTGHNGFVTALAWSPNSEYIASGSWDDTVQVWNAHTGDLSFKYLYNAPELPEEVNAVAWSPDGNFLAVGGKDENVHILNALTGKQIYEYLQFSVVNAVAWSPKGDYIASGDRDGTVEVWEALTGIHITTYNGHKADIFALAWSPDSRYLASGSVDHTAQVWQAATGNLLVTYRGHSNDVAALAWSPDGRYIASGSWDDTVQVWQATYGVSRKEGTGSASRPPPVGD
jgi:WD40 repeat protein